MVTNKQLDRLLAIKEVNKDTYDRSYSLLIKWRITSCRADGKRYDVGMIGYERVGRYFHHALVHCHVPPFTADRGNQVLAYITQRHV